MTVVLDHTSQGVSSHCKTDKRTQFKDYIEHIQDMYASGNLYVELKEQCPSGSAKAQRQCVRSYGANPGRGRSRDTTMETTPRNLKWEEEG